MHLNFWQHYKLTGDVEFLRDYLYPLMASAARYGRSVMTGGEDGRLHILHSHSPEQANTDVDPAIDRAHFGAVLWRREWFLQVLARALQEPTRRGRWTLSDGGSSL